MADSKPFLGILQVNTTFHRPPGDVGNLATWQKHNIPVKIKIVTATDSDEVVKSSRNYSQHFIDSWLAAAQQLVEEGAIAIITLCGFLATLHPILQSKLSVPVGTSALLQVPIAFATTPGASAGAADAAGATAAAGSTEAPKKKIGIITFDAANLGREHLVAVGVSADLIDNNQTPIVGVTPNGAFQRILRHNEPFDYNAIENEVVDAAQRLVRENEGVLGIVLECTNIPPYKNKISEAVGGLPVWDIITLGKYLYEAAVPESYA